MAYRGMYWSDNEVKALISLWGESNIQEELDGATRNKKVFEEIAEGLNEQGIERDWEQCRNKIKNLKKDYKIVKDNNKETGRERKTCKYFREMDEILGTRPATEPHHLLDSGEGTTAEEPSQELGANDTTPDLAVSSLDINASDSGCGSKEHAGETEPPKKRRKVKKKTRTEKALQSAMDTFVQYQREAEERFLKHEEELRKKEMEMEERRQKEEREHEFRIMQMLGQMNRGSSYYQDYHDTQY